MDSFPKHSDEYSDQDEEVHGSFKKVRLEKIFSTILMVYIHIKDICKIFIQVLLQQWKLCFIDMEFSHVKQNEL